MSSDAQSSRYTVGPLVALLTEYRFAISQFSRVLHRIPENFFHKRLLRKRKLRLRSIHQITRHTIAAAFEYANLIAAAMGTDVAEVGWQDSTIDESLGSLRTAFRRMELALQNKTEMDDNAISRIKIRSPWEATYDLEQMLEHAIVHVLRHRQQIVRLSKVKSLGQKPPRSGSRG